MAKPTIDGPGQAKLEQLETATSLAQTVHGLVEKYAIAIRAGQPTNGFGQQIKRAATPLVGLLRSQFQLLADLASDLILVATRGGGADPAKLRMLRERVGQLKSGIELAVTSTLAKHAVKVEEPASDSEVQ
ncbi:MAG: hypothetical protein V4813_11375 [Gemmatimonadota bacterium]